jgi:hypothetical protein
MTPQQLSALRRLLHYSAPEAARWIAADRERPQGVEERTWNRWESGARPVPPNIAARALELVAWRRRALDAARQLARGAAPGAPALLVWYDDGDDWPEHGALWRPAQSAAAALLAELGPDALCLVPFDARAYRAWLSGQPGRPDDAATRTAWASAQPCAQAADGGSPTVPVQRAGGSPAVPVQKTGVEDRRRAGLPHQPIRG